MSKLTEHKSGRIAIESVVVFFVVTEWVLLNGSTLELVYGNIIITLFTASFAVGFFLKKSYKSVKKYNLLILFLFLCIYVGNYIVYSNQCWGGNQALVNILMLVCSFLFAEQITYNQFKRTFVNVMCIIAAISLVMHFGAMFFPLVKYAVSHGRILMLGLHNYWAFSVGRNSGPFWEPGAFQIFLNLALVFGLQDDDFFERKSKPIILIMAILTTKSTTGYFVLFVIIAKKMYDATKVINSKFARILMWIGYIIGTSILFAILLQSGPVQDKLFVSNGSTNMRLNDLKGSIELLVEIPFYGVGINTYYKDTMLNSKNIVNNSVGVLASAINYGVVYILIYLICVIKNIKKNTDKQKILLFVWMVSTAFSQAVFEYPIMFMLLFRFKSENQCLVDDI